MKSGKRKSHNHPNRFHRWVLGFAIITIPVYTLVFSFSESPFDYTLSQIGNYFDWDHRLDFIIWGVITGGLLVFYLRSLFRIVNFHNRKANRWLVLSNVFLVLTVLTPSIQDVFPILTRFHLIFTVLFALSLVLSVMFFVEYLAETDKSVSHNSIQWAKVVIGGSLVCLFVFGKTGIFEIFFFVSFSLYLLGLGLWLGRYRGKTRDDQPGE